MPGASVLIERYYRDRAAGLAAGRAPNIERPHTRLSNDHAGGLAGACAELAEDLREYRPSGVLATTRKGGD